MPKHDHNHPVQAETNSGYVEYRGPAYISVRHSHGGAPPSVRIRGDGAPALRDALLNIVGAYFGYLGTHSGAAAAIRELFEEPAACEPDPGELRASLDEAAESLAHARKLLGG